MRQELAFHALQNQGTGVERRARDSCKRLGFAYHSVEAVSEGRNSGAFTVKTQSGEFILKNYRQSAPDATARFVRELNFLSWANREMIDKVPTVLATSFRSRWIAMEKCPGISIKSVGDQHLFGGLLGSEQAHAFL